jgi:hypothetical protein
MQERGKSVREREREKRRRKINFKRQLWQFPICFCVRVNKEAAGVFFKLK